MTGIISCKLDTSGLMKMQQICQAHSKRSPAESLNKTVYFIVKSAMENTPVTSPAKIDMELNVQSSPRISARTGRPVSSKTKNPVNINVTEGGLATRITLARLHYNSRYNRRTDRRYYMIQSMFSPGQGRSGFWKKVEQTSQRMVKNRHSSSAFFKSSWLAILQRLYPMLPPGYRKGAKISAKPVNEELGDIVPAVVGGLTCTCIIENKIGTENLFPITAARRNAHAIATLAPILQNSINQEFQSKLELAVKNGWVEISPQLKECGFVVTT